MEMTVLRSRAVMMVLAASLLGFSTIARADFIPASWDETLDFGDPGLSVPPARTYTHDLTTDGFRPLHDYLDYYDLSVDLVDDHDRWWKFEKAIVDVPGIIGDRYFFDLSGSEYGGWSLAGWTQLNLYGQLTVTVDRYWGDFYLSGSSLVGYGYSKVAVPEPGTLGLLGLGLVAVGFARRNRRA